jgi:hypothetical protein
MLKLKASAFWAIVKKDKPNNVQNVFNFLCPFFVAGQCFKPNGTIYRYKRVGCKNHTKINKGLYK